MASMLIDFNEISTSARYFVLTQTIIPRPIAWVLTEHDNGSFNLAPFSYFNAVCSDPPLVMLSIGNKKDGSPKDTRANIQKRKRFVVHIAHRELMEAMNDSSAELPAEVSEVDELELKTTGFEGFELPRLADARVALGCTLYDVTELGPKKQAFILGEVERVWIDDEIAEESDGRYAVDAMKLDPVGRLGPGQFMTFGELVRLTRPVPRKG